MDPLSPQDDQEEPLRLWGRLSPGKKVAQGKRKGKTIIFLQACHLKKALLKHGRDPRTLIKRQVGTSVPPFAPDLE